MAGAGDVGAHRIRPVATEVVFSKTGDRKVMNSLNDLVHCARANIEYNRDTPIQTSTKLVEAPLGALQYAYPREAMQKLGDIAPRPLPDNVIPFRRKE